MQSNTSFHIYTQMEKIRKIIWNYKKKTWKWFLSIRFFCECFLPLSDFSQIFPRLLPDFPQIFPRLFPDFSLDSFRKRERESWERRKGKTTQMYCKASVQHYIGMKLMYSSVLLQYYRSVKLMHNNVQLLYIYSNSYYIVCS